MKYQSNCRSFGKLFRGVIIARFAEATSILIKGGIPITQAIEIASLTIDNVVLQRYSP